MFNLPKEIQTKIFSYDSTHRDTFHKVVHQIKMIPVFDQLNEKYLFYTHSISPKPWWVFYFKAKRHIRRKTSKNEIVFIRKIAWIHHWRKKISYWPEL